MASRYQTAVFGQLVRWMSRGKAFRYPDEIDASLWEKAATPDASRASSDEEAQDGSPGGSDVLVVGWYGPGDPENPQNWSPGVKHSITFQMCMLNFAVYIASSIYTPGEPFLMSDFHVGQEVATLGLSLFTLGYGFGPMLWSPLSEMPRLGRTGIFFWTLMAFVLFQLVVGFAPNVAVFLVFRWVTGFCGSPCLATGGGTINDIYPPTTAQYCMCIWAAAGILGPVLGPLIGGFVAPVEGWRWTIWVFTWLCSVVLIIMFFFFPETSADNILYNRAKRLRKATGDDRLKSRTEIDSAHYSARENLLLVGRAFILTFGEPIVLLMDLFAGLLYGVLFVWFESFPLVFGGIYDFTSGEQGLVFLGILVFAAISVPSYLFWIKKCLIPPMLSEKFKPEMVLPPTIIGAFALPICLFWFGWTSRASVHWIVPIIGSGLFSVGIVTLFNSLYLYIGIVYSKWAASVFAGATLFRASFGASFPLFARPLFDKLGIGPGNSLLGAIAVVFIPIPFVFHRYGERIRSWSKYAG